MPFLLALVSLVMELKPYSYQQIGIDTLVKYKRMIVADTMGLGKTMQAILALDKIGTQILILCPIRVAYGVWRDEIKKWTGEDAVIIDGTPKQREKQYKEYKASGGRWLIAGTSQLEHLTKAQEWSSLVIDEYHLTGICNADNRARGKKGSVFFRKARKIIPTIPHFIPISGTPQTQGPHQFWGALHLMYPKKFRSNWRFVEEFCKVNMVWAGNKQVRAIEREPKDPERWQAFMKNFMLRRTKEEVFDELPPKIRSVVPISMKSKQRKIYKELANMMMLQLPDDGVIVTPNMLSNMTRLRQLLVSPQLLSDEYDTGAMAQAILDMLSLENAACIMTPFVGMIEIMKSLIAEKLPNFEVFVIRGGMKSQAKSVADAYEAHQGHKVMLATIQSAVAYSIPSCEVMFFAGCAYTAQANEQAEDRAHRVTTKHVVRYVYIEHENTLDERVLEGVRAGRQAELLILKHQDFRV